MYCTLGEDAPLWGVDVGEGNDLSDLTQSVSLVLWSLGEGRPEGKVPPNFLANNLLSPSGIPGDGTLVTLNLLLSAPSGTG